MLPVKVSSSVCSVDGDSFQYACCVGGPLNHLEMMSGWTSHWRDQQPSPKALA